MIFYKMKYPLPLEIKGFFASLKRFEKESVFSKILQILFLFLCRFIDIVTLTLADPEIWEGGNPI